MKTAALEDLADLNPRAEYIPKDKRVSFVGMAQLDARAGITTQLDIRPFGSVRTGYTMFRDSDILAAKITPCWENGKIGQARLSSDIGVGSTEFHVIRPGPRLDKRYLLHFLRQPTIRDTGELRMKGSAGQKRVPISFFQQLEVPLPAMAEQRRIAAILDQADAIRAKRRQALALLDTLTQSIFHHMFGNRPWTSTLGDLASVQVGPFGSLLHKDDYVSGGVPILNPVHIQDGRLTPDPEFAVTQNKASTLPAYRVQAHDVILGRRGEMGRAAIASDCHDGMLCGTGSLILRPRRVNPVFMHAIVTSPRMKAYLERYALGSTLPNLNAGIVKAAPAITVDIEEQNEFDNHVVHVNAQCTSVQHALDCDNELFASLQSRAFRGELS